MRGPRSADCSWRGGAMSEVGPGRVKTQKFEARRE
jgi:hypothetical protein